MRYYIRRNFWQNLGMTLRDMKELTDFEYEMYLNIMSLEGQFQQKNIDKANKKWQKRY